MTYRILTEQEFAYLKGKILYEDNHLLIVYKNIGEISQGDKTGDECIADTYKAYIAQRDAKPGQVFMGVPHRIDRPVSGILILAKTSKALERLTAMFRNSEIQKSYLALCQEKPLIEEGELSDYLVRNEKMNKSFVVKGEAPKAKLAKLRYRYLRSNQRYHLLEVNLYTGRHHQIRCQLANMGCVIKGDLKYGAKRSNPDGGICLHAYKVNFVHPVKKEPIEIITSVPDTWKI